MLIFTSFYLESCIWPDAISWWIRERNCIKFCANLGKSETETLAMIRQGFGEKARAVHGKSELTETEKFETGEAQSQERAHHFLRHQGVFTSNSSWQAKQSIPHATVTFYDDCVKMSEDFFPNFCHRRTDCCITTTHHLTFPCHQGIFLTENNRACGVSAHMHVHYTIYVYCSSLCWDPLWHIVT
jgi:hypothetical protein